MVKDFLYFSIKKIIFIIFNNKDNLANTNNYNAQESIIHDIKFQDF